MVNLRHPLHAWLSLCLLLMVAAPIALLAQGDSRYKTPPSLVGRDGKVLIGITRGVIYTSSVKATGGMVLEDSLLPGNQLPADLHGIWYFSMPNREEQPDLVYGLASYKTEIDSSFGFLKSTDFGETWTLTKPAGLADTNFRVTTNYWLQGLSQMYWLPDAQHGWAYGKRGIARTTDGGATWEAVMTIEPHVPQGGQTTPESGQVGVWALCFKSADSGVASIGPPAGRPLKYTTDGGKTWTDGSFNVGSRRTSQIDYVAGSFWAVAYERDQLDGHLSHHTYFSKDGRSWQTKYTVGQILREPTQMDELLWAGVNKAFFVLRSGDIWKSVNPRGVNPFIDPFSSTPPTTQWTNVQAADSSLSGYPISPFTGWGQRSVLMKDQFGNDVIVHASTIRDDGNLYRLLAWPVEVGAGVSSSSEGARAMNLTAYPNPTSSEAEVRFTLRSTSEVRLSVVDMLGRQVVSRDLGRLSDGEHRVSVDLTGAPSGAYHYIVTAGDVRGAGSLVVNR